MTCQVTPLYSYMYSTVCYTYTCTTLSHPLTVQVTMSSWRSPPPPPSPLGATVGAEGQMYKHKMAKGGTTHDAFEILCF